MLFLSNCNRNIDAQSSQVRMKRFWSMAVIDDGNIFHFARLASLLRNYEGEELLVVEIDPTVLVGVVSLEWVSQRLQRDAELNEVVKSDGASA